jgi:hypothetical protein
MKKTNVLITLITILLSTSAVAAPPTTILLKAEPAQTASLKSVKLALDMSFSTLKLDTDYTQPFTNDLLSVQKEKLQRNKIVNVTSNQIAAD